MAARDKNIFAALIKLARLQKVTQKIASKSYVTSWGEIGWLVVIAFVCWAFATLVEPYIGYSAVGCVFLFSVCISGLFLSRSSVFYLAFILSSIHNYFFIPPLYTLTITRPEDFAMLIMFFTTAAALGHLTSLLKLKEKMLRSREERAIALYETTDLLAKAQSIDDVGKVGITQIGKINSWGVAMYLPENRTQKGKLKPHPGSNFTEDAKDNALIQWVFQHARPAGKFTDTFPLASGYYIPLLGKGGTLGVLGIKIAGDSEIDGEILIFIENCAKQIASALEREILRQQSKNILILEEAQKLYKSLFDTVSHELKTPLSAIKGSVSALLDEKIRDFPESWDKLALEIMLGVSRLQRLVENLLDMSRLESGILQPKALSCGIEDLLSSAIRKLYLEIPNRKIKTEIEQNLTNVIGDPVLIEQAFTNILHNALIYSPENTEVEIAVSQVARYVRIDIKDHGLGLPRDFQDKIFEKFYRAHPEKAGGIGLGLSIAKQLIELQKGYLTAQNAEGGGALFSIYFPREVSH